MIVGSAVDLWLTSSEKAFRDTYTLVSRRDTSDEYQLNPAMYKEVEDICNIVSSQEAFKALKGYKTQKILQFDTPIGEHFEGLCGIPDFLKIKDNKAIIVDLKTSANVNPDKYYWTCVSYGYFQQAAMYIKLVEFNNPTVTDIEFWHLVVDSTNILHPVYTFKFTKEELNKAGRMLELYIEEIINEKDFLPRNVSWDDARIIGQ